MLIIATASHLSSNLNILKKMILSGSDVLRFNFSYGTAEEKMESIRLTQNVISELNSSTKILIDLPNPKIRLGDFPQKTFTVQEGDKIILKTASYSDDPIVFLPVQLPNAGNELFPEQTIVIDEGEVAIKIISVLSSDSLECLVLNSGTILRYKGINVQDNPYNMEEHIRQLEEKILPKLISLDPNYIACPFVDSAIIAEKYKTAIEKLSWNVKPKIILKIESEEGVKNAPEIINYGDMILMERGNLGIHAPFEKIGLYQKYLIALCKKNNKPLIIATQILESTIHNYIPQRCELSDLTNMVLDGVDGIMLCHETGISMRPAYPISIARKIIAEVENYRNKNRAKYEHQRDSGPTDALNN
ncbi:hypothetical protein EPN28_02525 [Patescibacteria group bacterium]|nr:MAG: hypothetical protein EPN28_02525 [Patescibacteria group bacterium]